MIEIVGSVDSHLPGLRDLLQSAGLPADVGGYPDTALLMATEHDEVLGGVAVEVYGRHGLLRSLVVAEARQGARLGRRLTTAAMDEAARRGLESLYLLTETAPGFFEHMGFSVIGRHSARDGIQESSAFRLLCPDPAVPKVRYV